MLFLALSRPEFELELIASKSISEISSLNKNNQGIQINPGDLTGHDCDPASQGSFFEPKTALPNNGPLSKIIVYPEKSIQTETCSIRKYIFVFVVLSNPGGPFLFSILIKISLLQAYRV